MGQYVGVCVWGMFQIQHLGNRPSEKDELCAWYGNKAHVFGEEIKVYKIC